MPADQAVSSFLGLEGLHVFITGAAGGIGGAAVKEFLSMEHTLLHHLAETSSSKWLSAYSI
jgi:NAD(P)-dependent dehydrogenase (short-subunit alcohol dehydrogenase family)